MKSYSDVRNSYLAFFKEKSHILIPAAPLVLDGDATTLFTSSGMQPLVPYLSGRESHSKGKRLVDVQPCIRTQDIDEVGDNRHTTFFEMLGNWSIGDYFKEDQLAWMWELYTRVFGLDPQRLYITVFDGYGEIPRDVETAEIWKKIGVADDHIYYYGTKSNWWSRSGTPDVMPIGEIGGPSTEMFYDFGDGPHNGPDSDEERFLEIGNSVFIQYIKKSEGKLEELPIKNVDFGGGLERILAAIHQTPDVFQTDVFQTGISAIENATGVKYKDYSSHMRVIADHMRASVFLLKDGVLPSNKEHGYILRRLLRRAAVKMYGINWELDDMRKLSGIAEHIIEPLKDIYNVDTQKYVPVISDEIEKFIHALVRGIHELEKNKNVNGTDAFNLEQSYGLSFEVTQEYLAGKGITIDIQEYEAAKRAHQENSRSASAGKFKGGLADTSDKVVKYHTATHLLQQALKDVFGDIIKQEGSNITDERLRFDTQLDHKPTEAEIHEIEKIINTKISENLPVRKIIMKREDAEKIGASAFFKDKYGDEVSIYYIGGTDGHPEEAYSKEFCGGPHVSQTIEIGKLEIFKTEKIGAQSIRFYLRALS